MTDDEREAREWLGRAAIGFYETDKRHRATILALLDEPRMPDPLKLTADDYHAMRAAYIATSSFYAVYEAMWRRHAKTTKPADPVRLRPKDLWGIEHASGALSGWVFTSRSDAEHRINCMNPGSRIVKLVEDRDE